MPRTNVPLKLHHTNFNALQLPPPLHIVVETNDYESTLFFLKNGADPNRRHASGWTPLHLAA